MTDYSKMSDLEINKRVAELIGGFCFYNDGTPYKLEENSCPAYSGVDFDEIEFDPCNNPADAWPIIIENHIAVVPYQHTLPQAWPTSFGLVSKFTTEDRKPLRAAMITFLKMQESKNAKIPSERDS
ncbi:TPA: phage protein NinX family protein [Klebsiella variicola subsp. variicola]